MTCTPSKRRLLDGVAAPDSLFDCAQAADLDADEVAFACEKRGGKREEGFVPHDLVAAIV